MKNSEALYGAADDLQSNGWTTGSEGMFADGGPRCALGAIGAVVGVKVRWGIFPFEDVAVLPAAQALAEHLGVNIGAEGEGVYRWNDAQDSPGPVIEALRAAAVIEAAKENDSRADLAAVGVAATGKAVR